MAAYPFADKITAGFYNIMGMDPYLWAICNESDEGTHMPRLTALKAVDPSESSMEVVLVDRCGDSLLKELEVKALEIYYSSGLTLELVKNLAQLVANHMGGAFKMEQGDLYRKWKLCSKQLRKHQQCIVIPIGSLSAGLCRHRAILFKKLADYLGLPCRIAHGCRYCTSGHPSSVLVKIEDSRHLLREYVVNLVGEPGYVNDPDSSINGNLLLLIPSPFQASHLRGCHDKYSSESTWSLMLIGEQESSIVANCHYPGLLDVFKGKTSKVHPSVAGDEDFIGKPYSEAVFLCQSQPMKNSGDLSVEFPREQISKGPRNMIKKQGCSSSTTIPRYLSLEPSFVVDWLEISWDELHIKKCVGPGSFGTVYRAEWRGSDVAVKVLNEQDFHEDQLKEFLRELPTLTTFHAIGITRGFHSHEFHQNYLVVASTSRGANEEEAQKQLSLTNTLILLKLLKRQKWLSGRDADQLAETPVLFFQQL